MKQKTRKWIFFSDHITCNGKNLQDEILNIKKYLVDKRHIYAIKKDDFLNSYFHIYWFKFNFQNFKNFWEYEKYIEKNLNYKKDFNLFLKYRKQNLNWFYEKVKGRKYSQFVEF